MTKFTATSLTRRERQIMDILYRQGRATAVEVMDALSGSPNYSTVRTQLRVLEEQGHVRHERHGVGRVYSPGRPDRPPAGRAGGLAAAIGRVRRPRRAAGCIVGRDDRAIARHHLA